VNRLVSGDWPDENARRLVEIAARQELLVPPQARARVWQRLEARRHKPRWKLAWPMFVAGAVCASLALLLLVPRDRPDASALVIASDGVTRAVRPGQALPPLPDLSLVDLHAAGRMVAGPGTAATLTRFDASGIELRLERGSLLAHVTPRPHRAPFLFVTPRFTAKVVGTVLRVVVHADGSASLAVGHGAVEVDPIGWPAVPAILVRSGERWPRDSVDAPLPSELERLGATDLEGVDARAFAPPAQAGSDLRDESTLYEAGFQALRDRDPRRALRLWDEERARFPRGVLRREVHASIIDALVALHDSSRARREIADYLKDDPNGLRAPEMHFVRATLWREADGDCRRALPELDRALLRPSEPWAARARAARAACHAGSRSRLRTR
jgi:hypothetical protein